MKKLLLLTSLVLLFALPSRAQDMIVTRYGDTLMCKILSQDDVKITYEIGRFEKEEKTIMLGKVAWHGIGCYDPAQYFGDTRIRSRKPKPYAVSRFSIRGGMTFPPIFGYNAGVEAQYFPCHWFGIGVQGGLFGYSDKGAGLNTKISKVKNIMPHAGPEAVFRYETEGILATLNISPMYIWFIEKSTYSTLARTETITTGEYTLFCSLGLQYKAAKHVALGAMLEFYPTYSVTAYISFNAGQKFRKPRNK